MFCGKCGNSLPDGAKFCDKCGTPTGEARNGVQESNREIAPEPERKKFSFAAPGFSGEAVYGTIGGAASAVSNALPGPVKVIGTSVKSFLTSLGSAFKDPKRMIPAIVLAVVWLILNILQACGINPIPTRIMSFLTFANGGMSGGFIGAVGGILGKGIFAGAVTSLIGLITRKGGEKRSFEQTLSGAFGVSLETLGGYLTGIGAAMLLYLLISGGAVRTAFMGGVAAAYLSARAALSNGFLRRILGSLTKSKSPSNPNVTGLVRGLSVGFAASALIGLIGIKLILIIAGALLLVGGAVLIVLQAAGALKLGKGAQAQ